MINPIYEYREAIRSGEILASKKIIKALDLIVKVLETENDWIFDNMAYQCALEFVETFCMHSKGKFARQPLILELWQRAIMATVFGIVHQETGLRKYREVLIVVARKNGKSTWASAIANYMLVGDGEDGAEVYAVAVKRDQADIVFSESKKMRDKSPDLRFEIAKTKYAMEHRPTESIYKPLSSETKSLDGLNGHCYIMDEVHAWTKQDLYDLCKGSLGSREQPLLFMISTAGTTRESVFDGQYRYAEQILEGKIEVDDFIPFIYELDEPDEWLDPEMFEKANPNLGVSIQRKYLIDYMNKAKASPTELTTFKTKHCNLQDNAKSSWLPWADIKKNNGEFDLEDWRGAYVVGGIDLSSTTDLTCATLLRENGDLIEVAQMYFIPLNKATLNEKKDKVPYKVWGDQGHITFTEGNKVDYHLVTEWFNMMVNEYDLTVLSIGYDEWNAQYLTDELEKNGYKMDVVRQGYKTLSPNMKLLEADVLDANLYYNNNPVLRWCLTNTSVLKDPAGNIKPQKTGGPNSHLRIDGLASLLDAYVVYQRERENLDFINSL